MMRRLRPLLAVGLGAFLAGCTTTGGGQGGFYRQVVRKSGMERLGDYTVLRIAESGQCDAVALPVIRVSVKPRHGRILIHKGEGLANDPRCVGRYVPSRLISYQANPGYSGTDWVEYSVHFANGEVAAIRKQIIVP